MKRFDAGFSLTELLVCFFISMLLISILIQHILSVSRQYQQTQAVLEETTELQWVFDVMRARIHHAGFTPCRSLNHLKTIDTRDKPERLDALEVEDDTKLLIRKMDENHFGLVRVLSPDILRIKNTVLKSNQSIIISDCTHAEIHDAYQIYQTKQGVVIKLKKPLVFKYSPETYVGAWISEAFFFRKHKGLLIKQRRVDLMAPAESIRFELRKHSAYSAFMMKWVSTLGKTYVFEARTRM